MATTTTMKETPQHVHLEDDGYISEDSMLDVPPPYSGRSSESSTQRADYDTKHELATDNSSIRSSTSTLVKGQKYALYHPKNLISRGIVITQGSEKTPIYYSEVSGFTLNKPDVTLHAIPEDCSNVSFDDVGAAGKSGPIVGVGLLPRFSRNMQFALGDVPYESKDKYIDLTNPNTKSHGEYRFVYRGIQFAWKRTHDANDGVEGGAAKRALSMSSYQLVNVSTNEPLVAFVENKWKSWKKQGNVVVLKDFDNLNAPDSAPVTADEMTVVTLLTLSAMLEKRRRRRNSGVCTGGGAGGGTGDGGGGGG